MKIDKEIIEDAIKQGMPQKPNRANFADDDSFEEAYGYWMSHYGRILSLRQRAKDQNQIE